MPRSDGYFCDCGGPLRRPIPRVCPHCGARLVGVRRTLWSVLGPVLLAGGLFAALGLYLWRLLGS